MQLRLLLGMWTALLLVAPQPRAVARLGPGPDVIIGEVGYAEDYARLPDVAGISMLTFSCNIGDRRANWYPLPDNRHPVIAQNMYRLMNGRLVQIGQSWLKHGFAALNYNNSNVCGMAGCQPSGTVYQLGVLCSDPYDAYNNRGPWLGPRWEVDPFTGYFDGTTANDHTGHIHESTTHGLQVKHTDLAIPGARYFVEGHYVAADDALAANADNNVSHREVRVTGSPSNWTFTNLGASFRGLPTVFSWPDATFSVIDAWPEDGRTIVAYKVTDQGGSWMYDYAIYNMNSARAVRALRVPVGSAKVAGQGFSGVAPDPYDIFVGSAWPQVTAGGFVTWETPLRTSPTTRTNPVRWGSMYNFWFEADRPPTPTFAALTPFEVAGGPSQLFVPILAPAAGDCNGNQQPDDEDILRGRSRDADRDGLPDECRACHSRAACGQSTACARFDCSDGWCTEQTLDFGDANYNGEISDEDIHCVFEAFSKIRVCVFGDVGACLADGVIDVDDALAVLSAVENEPVCCDE